jgi:hypothetical protein
MNAITTQAAALPRRPRPVGRMGRLLGRLSALALAAAERLTSPYRDVPPDYYRFPPF